MDDSSNYTYTDSSETGDFLNSTDAPIVRFSLVERQILSGILFLSSAIGILGNTAVVLAVLTVKTLQTTTNVFVVNLALADFLTCIDTTLQSVLFLSDELVFPLWLCQVMAFGILVCIGCSVNTLMCIAVNRLVGITTKTFSVFRKLFTPCNLSLMVALTWCVPVAMAVIPVVSDYGELGYTPFYSTCTWQSSRAYQPRYGTVVAIVYLPVQLAVLFASYLKIYLFVRKTTRSTLRQDDAGDSNAGNRALQMQLLKRQVAVTKNLCLVMFVFLLCIAPYFVLLGLPSKISNKVLPYASTILMANSSVNPIIYGTKHPDFRRAFARLLRCGRKKSQTASQTQSAQTTSKRNDCSTTASTGVSMNSEQTQM